MIDTTLSIRHFYWHVVKHMSMAQSKTAVTPVELLQAWTEPSILQYLYMIQKLKLSSETGIIKLSMGMVNRTFYTSGCHFIPVWDWHHWADMPYQKSNISHEVLFSKQMRVCLESLVGKVSESVGICGLESSGKVPVGTLTPLNCDDPVQRHSGEMS